MSTTAAAPKHGIIGDVVAKQLRMVVFGATSEHLAAAFLSSVAFTTKVQRENDLGHDFHCVLHDPTEDPHADRRASGVVVGGLPFNVQVKSDPEPIVYEGADARRWLARQHGPFLVCVVIRSELSFTFYSAWNVRNGIQLYGDGGDGQPRSADDRLHFDRIELVLGQPTSGLAELPTILPPEENDHVLSIPLGPPILTKNLQSVMEASDAKIVAQILKDWIEIDRANIARESMRMHWVYGPVAWQTNSRLDEGAPMNSEFYFHQHNLDRHPEDPQLPTLQENLVRSAVALQLTIAKHRASAAGDPPGVTPELENALTHIVVHSEEIMHGDRAMRDKLLRHRELVMTEIARHQASG